MKLLVMGMEYPCERAVKDETAGSVYAFDEAGRIIFQALKVKDFSGYTLEGGEWSDPAPDERADMDAMLVDHEYRLTLLEQEVA